jgi:hypothetical protein
MIRLARPHDVHGGTVDLMHFHKAATRGTYRSNDGGLIGADVADGIAILRKKIAGIAKVQGSEDALGNAALARGESVRHPARTHGMRKDEVGLRRRWMRKFGCMQGCAQA